VNLLAGVEHQVAEMRGPPFGECDCGHAIGHGHPLRNAQQPIRPLGVEVVRGNGAAHPQHPFVGIDESQDLRHCQHTFPWHHTLACAHGDHPHHVDRDRYAGKGQKQDQRLAGGGMAVCQQEGQSHSDSQQCHDHRRGGVCDHKKILPWVMGTRNGRHPWDERPPFALASGKRRMHMQLQKKGPILR
jgi:hypothetical protein